MNKLSLSARAYHRILKASRKVKKKGKWQSDSTRGIWELTPTGMGLNV